MSEFASLIGWNIDWCQKLKPGEYTQNTTFPQLLTDPNQTKSLLYDEDIAYGLYFKVQRNDPNYRVYIKAGIEIFGIKDPVFFTRTMNAHFDPREPLVEIPFGPQDTIRQDMLYWPYYIKDFHKVGVHAITISLGTKKYSDISVNPPSWISPPLKFLINVTGIVPN